MKIICFIILILQSSGVWAQNDIVNESLPAQSLEELLNLKVITATGFYQRVDSAPATVHIITAEQIRMSGVTTFADTLEIIPGVHVSAKERSPLFSFRGIHTLDNPHILTLVNGVSIDNAHNGSRSLSFRMLPQNIKQIEVTIGPGSAIYGADAYAGIINIITYKPSEISRPVLTSTYGSFETWQLGAIIPLKMGRWSFLASANRLSTNGDKGRVLDRDQQTNYDETYGSNASNAPGPVIANYDIQEFRLEAEHNDLMFRIWFWEQLGAGTQQGLGEAIDPTGETRNKQTLIDLNWNLPEIIPNWKHELKLNAFFVDFEGDNKIFPPGTVLPANNDGDLFADDATPYTFKDGLIFNFHTKEKQFGFDFNSHYQGLDNHNIRIAFGYKRMDFYDTEDEKNFNNGVGPGVVVNTGGTSLASNFDSGRRLKYLSLQDVWTLNHKWAFTLGVRVDEYSDFGTTINPRLALNWISNNKWSSKLLYGEAFRAPSIKERSFGNNPINIGNSDLSEEKIRTIEWHIGHEFTNTLRLNTTIFAYKMTNQIREVSNGSTGQIISKNVAKQTARGIETQLDWLPKLIDFHFQINYAQHNAHNSITGEQVAKAPRRQYGLKTNWRATKTWQYYLEVHRVTDRPRAISENREGIPNYTQFNFGSSYTFSKATINFSVRNIFDEDIREQGDTDDIPNDIPMNGRQLLVHLRMSF